MYGMVLFYLLILVLICLICYRSMPRYSSLDSVAKGWIKIKANTNATAKNKKKGRMMKKRRERVSSSYTTYIPRTRAGGSVCCSQNNMNEGVYVRNNNYEGKEHHAEEKDICLSKSST